MKKIIAIIPARMGSSRFYGKPLKLINKISMIERVYKNVKKCHGSLAHVIGPFERYPRLILRTLHAE